jgi:hypothetical protein
MCPSLSGVASSVRAVPAPLDPDVAVACMRAAQVEPLEPYRGSLIPWRCRCLRCDRVVWPRLSDVRNQGQRACAYCAGKKIDPAAAAALMRAANLEPQVPFSSGKTPWRCRCTVCERVVTPCYANVRNGTGGCVYCAGNRVDEAAVEARVRAAGWELLASYPGSGAPWPVKCVRCDAITTKRWNDVRSGVAGCRFCAQRAVHPAAAEASMLAVGLQPLEPYRGNHYGWLCRCLVCLEEYRPRLNTVRSDGSGCFRCGIRRAGQLRRIDSAVAASRMQERGFEPEEPYPGSHAAWRCRHDACGNVREVTYHAVVDGGIGCADCAVSGFKPGAPALVYVITHEGFAAHKVGITGVGKYRLQQWRNRGWSVVMTREFAVGVDARAVEQTVLDWLRGPLALPAGLPPGMDGWTESVPAGLLPVEELVARVGKVLGGSRNTVYRYLDDDQAPAAGETPARTTRQRTTTRKVAP